MERKRYEQMRVLFSYCVLLLVAVFVCYGSSIAQCLVSLDFKETDIRDVARAISMQTDCNVVVDPGVSGSVTIRLVSVPLDEGLRLLVSTHGWDLETDGDLYIIKPKMPSQATISFDGGLLYLRLDGASLLDVCIRLADVTGKGLVFLDEPHETVYLRLQGVDLDTALTQLLKPYNYVWWEDRNIIFIDKSTEESIFYVPESETVSGIEALQIHLLPDGKVNLRADDISVRRVLAELALTGKFSMVVDEEVDAPVNLVLYSTSIEEAITTVVRAVSLNATKIDNLWWIGTQPLGIAPETPSAAEDEPSASVPLIHEGIKDLVVSGNRLSGLFTDVPLSELINAIRLTAPESEQVPSVSVQGSLAFTSISGAISDLPIIDALSRLVEAYDLQIVVKGDGYIIKRKYVPTYTITYEDGLLSIIAKGASMVDLLQEVGQKTSVSFILPKDLPQNINISLHDIQPDQALAALLRPYSYELVQLDPGKAREEWSGGLYEVVAVQELPVEVSCENELFMLRADDAQLSEVIHEISRISGANILLQKSSFAPLSIELRNLTLDELLNTLMKVYGGKVVNEGTHYYLEIIEPSGIPSTSQTSSRPTRGIDKWHLTADRIDIKFIDISLETLLNEIRISGGLKFEAEDSLKTRLVSGEIVGSDPAQAVKEYLLSQNYILVPLNDKTIVRSQNSPPLVYYADGLFYLDINGGDLVSFIRDVANKAGKPLVMYNNVRGSVSNIRVYEVTFEEALAILLSGTTFSYRFDQGIYYIGEGITPRSDSPGFTEARIIELKYLAPPSLLSLLPPDIPSQNIRVVPGRSAVVAFGNQQLLQQIEDFVKVVDSGPLPSPALLPIRFVKADDVVNILARYFSQDMYQYVESQKAVLLTSTPENNERIMSMVELLDVPELATAMEVIPVKHLQANEAREYLAAFSNINVVVLNEQNEIVVSGNSYELAAVREYIKAIDKPNPQILFEVRIVEITDRSNLQLGFSGDMGQDLLEFDLLSSSPFVMSIGSALIGDPQLTLTLSTLIQEGKARLLANPILTTLNGKEASFNVLTTSRYWVPQTEVKKDDDNGESSAIQSFRTIETGIRLRLKPWVSANGEITIELQPEISDSAGSSSGSGLPSTNDRAVYTTVRVRDGETIVIGGLIQRKETKEVAKVPFLGDLPILGRLFRSENKTEIETEFIIAITCRLICDYISE